MKTTIFAILLFLLWITSCTKLEKTNPFDPNCPKELWTPTNFIATLEGTTVKLTWSQPVALITGFKISKKIGNTAESMLPNQTRDANQLSDNALTGGQVHVYTLYAYAENNKSNSVTVQVTPALLTTVTTSNPTSVLSNSLIVGGAISTEGGSPITERGICWGTTTNPTTVTNKLAIGTGTGTFSNTISGLLSGTLYYFRAYAINSQGTAYGNEVTATTLAILPVIATTVPSGITSSAIASGGNITSDGGAAITARGICWGIAQNPTIDNSKNFVGTGTGSFASAITGLNPGTTYYIRAFATNSFGTVYGNEETAKTLSTIPVLTSTAISAITSTAAISGGNITSDGGAAVTVRGICWSTSQNPTIADPKTSTGTGSGSFIGNLTGLTAGVTYYVRAYATNSMGTAYGNELTLTTVATLPTLTTIAVSAITSTTAASGGNITSDGGSAVTVRGICWSKSQNPTIADAKTSIGTGSGSFASNLTDLSIGATYYVRAYATNSVGTAYGNEEIFTTTSVTNPTVNDIDGNVYHTVTIGPQIWMVENLKTTKFKDGIAIPNVTGNTAWADLNTPGYCWYNNDITTYKNPYGALYNYYTIETAKLCPTGWHVPTNDDWSTLTTFLGGNTAALDKIKEIGTIHWLTNLGATNSSGFTSVPSGYRTGMGGIFTRLGSETNWWSSTKTVSYGTDYINYMGINRSASSTTYYPGFYSYQVTQHGTPFGYSTNPTSYDNSQEGYSVRCIKD